MKAPICLSKNNTKAYMKERYNGIRDVGNDQGFAIGQFPTQSAIWNFSDVRKSIQQSKRMDELLLLC